MDPRADNLALGHFFKSDFSPSIVKWEINLIGQKTFAVATILSIGI